MLRRLPVLLVPILLLAFPAGASAVTVTKASLSGGELRIEGSGAVGGTFVRAESATSVAGARADTKGAFKIQASGFRADDCHVTVFDSRGPVATPALSGCTPKPVTPPVDTPPTGSCVISPGPAVTFHVGDVSSDFFSTTGCDTSAAPVQWSLVSGQIPPGMSAPIFQGQTGGSVTGTPNLEGTYTFTVRVTDSVGASDVETFTIEVVAPRPLTITNPVVLPSVARGQAYQVLLTADGGLPGYTYRLAAGTIPPGLQVASGSIAGHPTIAGTFAFSVAVTDSRGTTATRTFSLTVS